MMTPQKPLFSFHPNINAHDFLQSKNRPSYFRQGLPLGYTIDLVTLKNSNFTIEIYIEDL